MLSSMDVMDAAEILFASTRLSLSRPVFPFHFTSQYLMQVRLGWDVRLRRAGTIVSSHDGVGSKADCAVAVSAMQRIEMIQTAPEG